LIETPVNPLWIDTQTIAGEFTNMATKIFVNLPVKNLPQSMSFFRKLGFDFNSEFTDDTAACMVVSEDTYVMLMTYAKFKEFTPKAICDATKSTEVLVCLSCDNRSEVDELVSKAVAAGGSTYSDSKDYGFMYQHGFQDVDGHIWELVYMDPGAVKQSASETLEAVA
jgi:predicted lactoylglutathione lyase